MSGRRFLAGFTALVAAGTLGACGQVVDQAAAELSGSGPHVSVVARNFAFQPATLSLPAGVPLRIELRNLDQGVPHSLVIHQVDWVLARTEIVTGEAATGVDVEPLAAAGYAFSCEVHPTMTGTLTVTP